MSGPLAGIRVLELGNFLAGPFCGMLLGDMGADVIKFEPPKGGDMMRATQPHIGGESANFMAVNRNKRSFALNLKEPAARDIFLRFVETADVVLENNRPGVMDSFGLGPSQLKAVNPTLVYAAISGFGQTGPYRLRAAVNLIVEAASGSLSVTGEPGGLPMRPGVQTGDMFGALFATYAVLSGLIGKLRHHEGATMDISLVEASLAAAVFEAGEYLSTGEAPQALGHRHRLTAPYQVFKARNGFIAVGCPNDQVFKRLMDALGLEAHVGDPRFASYSLRKANEDAVVDLVGGAIGARDVREVEDMLAKAGVPCSMVNDYKQVFESPQISTRNMIAEVEHPRAGPIRMVRNPILFEEGGPAITRAAPILGQHTRELMLEVGYQDDAIRGFAEAGVIGLGG